MRTDSNLEAAPNDIEEHSYTTEFNKTWGKYLILLGHYALQDL